MLSNFINHILKQLSLILLLVLILIPSLALAQVNIKEFYTKKSKVKFWLNEDKFLPIVAINIIFKNSGTAYDPKDKLGLAILTTSLLDEGSGDLSDIEFKKKLEEYAIQMDFGVTKDYMFINIKTLSKNLAATLDLLEKVLISPDFDNKAIERSKNQAIARILSLQEDPGYLALNGIYKGIFKTHPYAHPINGTIENIRNITKADLQKYVRNNFTKDNLIISVAGDAEEKNISALIDQTLDLLPTTKNKLSELPVIQYNNKPELISISKPLPQNTILMGFKSVKRTDPDYYAAYITNYILGGGGFESRLMKNLREKNGLVYSTSSDLDLFQQSGIMVLSAATRKTDYKKTKNLMNEILEDAKKGNFSEVELNMAKKYLTGSFPLQLITNTNIAQVMNSMQLNNLPIDFIQKRDSFINGVTLATLNSLAPKLLDNKNMVTVIVGSNL